MRTKKHKKEIMESAEYKKKELAKMFIQHPGVLTFSCCTEKKKSDFFLLQKQNTTETVCSLIPEKCSVLKCQSFSFSCAACNIQLDSYTNTLKHLKHRNHQKNMDEYLVTEDQRFESMMRQKLELTSMRSKLRTASDVIISDPNFPFIGLQHMLEILPCENDKPAIFLCSLPFCEFRGVANEIKTHVASEKHLQGYLNVNEVFGEKTEYCHICVATAMRIPECIPLLKNLYENSKLIHGQEKTIREKNPSYLIKKISDTHQYEIARKGRYPQFYHDFVDARLCQKAEKKKLAEEAMNSNLSKSILTTTTDSSYSTDENMAPTSGAAEYNLSSFFEPSKLVASDGLDSSGYSTYYQNSATTLNRLGTASPTSSSPNDYWLYQNAAPTLNTGVGATALAHNLYDFSTYQTQAPTFNNAETYSPDYSSYQNTASAAFNNFGTATSPTLTNDTNDFSPGFQTLVPTFNNLALSTPPTSHQRSNSGYSTSQNKPPTTFSTPSKATPSRISMLYTGLSGTVLFDSGDDRKVRAKGWKQPCYSSSYYLAKDAQPRMVDTRCYLAPPPPAMPPASRPNEALRKFQQQSTSNQSLDTSYDLDPPPRWDAPTVEATRANPLPLVRVTYALDLFKKKVEEIVLQNCLDEDFSMDQAEVDVMVKKLCKDEFIVHHNLGGSLQHIQMTENISGRIKNRLNSILLPGKSSKVQENAKKKEEKDANQKAKESAKKKATDETAAVAAAAAAAKEEADAERRILQRRLFDAIANRDFKMVEYCLQNGADVNFSMAGGVTPLHTAAACANFEILKILLQYGADVNAMNENGFSPMDVMNLAAAEETERRIA